MNVLIKLKSVGKRKPVFDDIPYTLPDDISSLRQLIEVIVRQEVESYNSRGVENMLAPFLTEAEISDQSAVGKIGFGRLYSDRQADPDRAVETALQGFEDGLFRVVIGQSEITGLDCRPDIYDGQTLTFIRLTFLAGRMF